jgi:hypothetical protein
MEGFENVWFKQYAIIEYVCAYALSLSLTHTHTYIYIYIYIYISQPYMYAEDGTIDLLSMYYMIHIICIVVYTYDIYSLNFHACHAIVLLIV